MKKIYSLLLLLVAALAAHAVEYKGQLIVYVNENESMQDAVITLEENDGSYDLVLKNFKLKSDGQVMPVGNIVVTGVKGTTEYGFTTIELERKVVITNGDDPTVEQWLGPLLGEVPLELLAKFDDHALVVGISIDMQETLEQDIEVNFIGSNGDGSGSGNPADVNRDGNVDVVDVNDVINAVLGK